MQINNNGITNNTANGNTGTQKANAAAKTESSSSTTASDTGDSVKLSQEARVLTELESKIAATADVDTSRVDSIRQAIADGSYSVDAGSIASKMIASDELF